MANLGSTDTPAAAQSLDLPNGYSPAFEEDSGDLVINDSNGNTVFRWDDTNGQFQLAAPLDADGNDVTNVGALGTEESDNAVNVNNFTGGDLGEKINNAVAAHGRENVVYNVKPGVYTLSTSADLTDHRGFSVDLSGTYITLATGGQPAFDLTDSWDYYFTFSRLVGDSTNPPSTGILSATTGDDPATGTKGARAGGPERKWVQGGVMWGDYQLAPLYHADRERARFSGDFANDNDQGYSFVVTTNNEVDIGGVRESESSPYKPDPIGLISNAKTWVSRASFLSILNSGDGIVWIEGTREIAFNDVEIFGKNEPGLVRFDATNDDINQVSFDRCRLRVDDLDNVSAESVPFRFEDSGNGNQVKNLHITTPNITTFDAGGTPQPMFDVTGATEVNKLTVDGGSDIATSVPPFDSPNEVKRVDLKNVPVGNLTLAGGNVMSGLDAESLALLNSAVIQGRHRNQTIIENDSGHAIRAGQSFSNAAVKNVTVKASGSGNDAINTAGTGTGGKALIENVRVEESDRDGIVIADMNSTVVADCTTSGFGSSISGADLRLTGSQLCIVSGCYFNGDLVVESGCNDNIINAFVRENLTDNGTRTVINGRGTNSGDPNSTGEWNGEAAFARQAGAVIEDTSNNNVYYPTADGSYSQLGT